MEAGYVISNTFEPSTVILRELCFKCCPESGRNTLAGMFNLITPQQLADELGTTVGNLAQMRYRGEGPTFVKVNQRSVRYRVEDVTAWLDSMRVEPDRECA